MVTAQNWHWRLGLVGILIIGEILVSSDKPTPAQISPDATLGAESSLVTPAVTIQGLPAEIIEGGATRGANLFHSFLEFNVGNGQRVYFANPTGIENILSRVTGGNLSNILGTLGVDGGANLFLLNPNGIIFGENAQLDIAGSFVASTANSLVFENGLEFSATNPEAPPLLTISVTPGLQSGTNQPEATITSTGNLAVGQNLTLVAGNLDLQGQLQARGNLTLQASDTLKVRDSASNPFIASSEGQLLIQGNQKVDIFALNHSDSGFYSGGDMILRSPNPVIGDAHYWSGGSFQIEQLDGSLGDLESPNDPIIRASGDVNFDTYRGTSLHILAGGSVDIDKIRITGADATGNTINPDLTPILANVTLSDGTSLIINGTAQPTLDIRAGTTAFGTPGITGTNFTTLLPLPNTIAPATGADITINRVDIFDSNGLVLLTNQYQPNTTLTGTIQLGIIDARSDVGDGSSVYLDSRSTITIGPGFISSRSSVGDSGDIAIIANNTVSLGGNNAYITSATDGGNSQNVGNINITAESLFINPGSFINADTDSTGDAGTITVNVRDTVSLTGSFISSTVLSGAVGNAGDINIQAETFSLTNGSQLLTSVNGGGQGNAGSLTVRATDSIEVDDSKLATETYGSGNGGDLIIETGNLSVRNRGEVSTGVFEDSSGQAGNLSVTALDSVELVGGNLATATLGAGRAGDLSVTTQRLTAQDGGRVEAGTLGIGQGGNVTVNASESVDLSGFYAEGDILVFSGVSAKSGDSHDNTGFGRRRGYPGAG